MSLSDLATKGLCGLCKEVSLSILPRLYMEEIMLELGRRNIDVRGEGVSKDDLVTILYELMTLEYREIDKAQEIVEGEPTSEDPLGSLQPQEGQEIHVEGSVSTTESLTEGTDESANPVNAIPQAQVAENIHEIQTTLVDTTGSCSFRYITTDIGGETAAVDESNMSELDNLMDTSADLGPTQGADLVTTPQSASVAGSSQQFAPTSTSTDRGLAGNEVRYVAVRPSTILDVASGQQQPGTAVPVVTVTTFPAPSVEVMRETSDEGMAGDSSDDGADEDVSQEDKEAAEDLVSLSLPAKEESSSQVIPKEENQATASPSDESTPKVKIPVKDRKTKRYPCPHCPEVYYMKHHMDVHIRRKHTGEKPYMCDRCGMRFFEKPKMEDHIRTHTGERPFKCNVCGRAFKDYSNLNTHRRLHTNVRPYKCKYCSYAANVSGDLQKHERTHTGERPYACETCGRAFADKSAWRRHNKIHTGEKPFRCFCGYSTNRKCNFMTHAKKHPGVTILQGQQNGEELVFETLEAIH